MSGSVYQDARLRFCPAVGEIQRFQVVELYRPTSWGVVFTTRMADYRPPFTSENLQQVLERLNDVMVEAARLRKEVIRQLGEQRAGQQQYLTAARKRKTARTRRR
jgi:hypothetical protein